MTGPCGGGRRTGLTNMATIDITFRAIEELQPEARWQGLFDSMWPSYRSWFLQAGDAARPTYADAVRMLRTHMPELVETYERLVELAGGGDLAARLLALYDPPPYLSGCSQGVLRSPTPLWCATTTTHRIDSRG
jgi:hypothetical protein